MSWINVAIMVGTAVVGRYEGNQVAKRQDNALAAQLRQQAASEDKVRARTAQMVQDQTNQTDQPQKTAAAQQYAAAIKANQQMADAPLATVGNVSDAYKASAKNAALGVSDYAANRGNNIAAIDAPGLQRQQNQKNIANYGIDVNQINHAQQGQDFLGSLKFNSIHANPWIDLLTGYAGGIARAKLGAQQPADLSQNIGYGGIDLSASYANRPQAAVDTSKFDGSAANSPWLKNLYGGS
jgi:hypothetical protein